jgi:hypothetical protein
MRYKTWLISLNYDFSKVFPESDIAIWRFFKCGLDYWHFPAPAYRIYPERKFFILYPFKMTIG